MVLMKTKWEQSLYLAQNAWIIKISFQSSITPQKKFPNYYQKEKWSTKKLYDQEEKKTNRCQ